MIFFDLSTQETVGLEMGEMGQSIITMPMQSIIFCFGSDK
jgi:hypothetical protein